MVFVVVSFELFNLHFFRRPGQGPDSVACKVCIGAGSEGLHGAISGRAGSQGTLSGPDKVLASGILIYLFIYLSADLSYLSTYLSIYLSI